MWRLHGWGGGYSPQKQGAARGGLLGGARGSPRYYVRQGVPPTPACTTYYGVFPSMQKRGTAAIAGGGLAPPQATTEQFSLKTKRHSNASWRFSYLISTKFDFQTKLLNTSCPPTTPRPSSVIGKECSVLNGVPLVARFPT